MHFYTNIKIINSKTDQTKYKPVCSLNHGESSEISESSEIVHPPLQKLYLFIQIMESEYQISNISVFRKVCTIVITLY